MVSSQQGYSKTTTDMTGNQEAVDKAQANLPLPEQPPAASDFNSASASTMNVGSGELSGDASSFTAGREAHDGLEGIPNDAVTRDAKNKKGLAQTTGKDYGTPPSAK
ncbi:hypothetical protein P153DRAFT_345695 [Dothidotthia symphoricarpi CBS 119687]|uniref:Uncharacterized protein n=1 Tax=Dothidotthia symphoricarpi CBS 119687 TaxID=1392245 RepID=A0A6A6A570_9PLEO|nr:uncharacterized protein P153DRAFT_345695 [Dothidotthia symphoricarpi CBS 119687]KAF2126950.1 hypothetical protein P153DRAFT_345695 [Dothidotthia symphoricarpi CBS 119687]